MKAEKKGQTFVWTISSFGKTLDALFAKSLTDHAGDIASSQKLIIDLRNNGGGYTDVATNILQWFVPA